MTMYWTRTLATPYFQPDGVATRAFRLLLPLSPTTEALLSTGPLEDLARLAVQSAAQFIQDICPIHSGAIVVQPEQSRVGHTGLLSQAINRPILLVEDFSKPASDHANRVAGLNATYQLRYIYQVCFTYYECRSKLARGRKSLYALSLHWKTTLNFCAGILPASLGLPVFAAEVQP